MNKNLLTLKQFKELSGLSPEEVYLLLEGNFFDLELDSTKNLKIDITNFSVEEGYNYLSKKILDDSCSLSSKERSDAIKTLISREFLAILTDALANLKHK